MTAQQKSPITTHVLDTTEGSPASGVPVKLEYLNGSAWESIGEGITNSDGRITELMKTGLPLKSGTYRLFFNTAEYFASKKRKSFYPQVTVSFQIENTSQHYHVPLLLSPFGYSTYRGS